MDTFFSYDENNNEWVAEHANHPTFHAVLDSYSMLGQREWTLFNDSKLCSGVASNKRILSLSSCRNDQFTCSDGTCVEMEKRLV